MAVNLSQLTPGGMPPGTQFYGGTEVMPFTGSGGPSGSMGASGAMLQPPTNILQTMTTGGYGTMPKTASPYSQALRSMGSSMNWQDLRYGGGQRRGEGMEGMSGAADEFYQRQQQDRATAEWDQMMRMKGLQAKLFERLLSLFGTGGTMGGGNLNVPMPVTADPNILAAIQAKAAREFEPLERQNQQISGRTGRYGGQSSWADTRGQNLAARKAGIMSEAYLPAQQATVAGYAPGLKAAEINQKFQLSPMDLLMAMSKIG